MDKTDTKQVDTSVACDAEGPPSSLLHDNVDYSVKDASITNDGRVEEGSSFEADIRVAPLVEPNHAETFGLVLVSGWPPDREVLLEPYYRMKAAVELCFDESDVASFGTPSTDDGPPPVYIYPATALHVTVATLHSMTQQPPGEIVPTERQGVLRKIWGDVIIEASQLKEWPEEPLQLVLESAQIGTKAGILLWKETTGGIEAMRKCIRIICEQEHVRERMKKNNISIDTLHLPNIIHSSFLRFYKVPNTPAALVQERFRETVLPRLREFFPNQVRAPTVTLVYQCTPYMHIPPDARHIVRTFTLG